MARDDEFRRVAEDIGALARSLGRDFREAVDQAMRGGHSPGRAVRHGLRGVRDEARRGLRTSWSGPYRRRPGRPWTPWGGACGPGWSPGPGYRGRQTWAPPPPPPGASARGPAGEPATGRPGAPPPHAGPAGTGWNRPSAPPCKGPARRGQPAPPVRHRWDATTVLGLLAVLFGVAWLIGATGALHLSIEGVVAVGLMLLGAALVVTGRTDWSLSRRSWPVWLGAALIAVLIATSSTFGLGGALSSVSFGNKTVVATPGKTVHGGFGDLTVTLPATVDVGNTINVASLAGRVIIEPPQPQRVPYHVTVNARVFGGQICANGQNVDNGLGAHTQPTFDVGQTNNNSPTLHLDVHQMFGQILINSQACGPR